MLKFIKQNMLVVVAAIITSIALMSFAINHTSKIEKQETYWFQVNEQQQIGPHLPDPMTACPDNVGDLCAIALEQNDVDLSDPSNPQPNPGVDINDAIDQSFKATKR